MDRLSAIGAFVTVADLGSFSRAAERLNIAKSVVSRQVSALEAELGARLFHRTTRSLTLTEVGRSYLERTRQILADLEEANQAVSQLQSAPRGKLRVNAPMSFGFLHLAQALPDFMKLYPEVSVDLVMNDRFVDLVDEGFDIAVRIGALDDSSLIARKLAPVRRVICASPDYIAARGAPAHISDLKSHECLVYMSDHPEWRFENPNGKPFIVAVHGRLSVNNGDALRVAALQGLGIANLPTFLVGDDLRAGRLVAVLQEMTPLMLTLNAVYPPTRHITPKVRAFVDFLSERFGPLPYWDEGV